MPRAYTRKMWTPDDIDQLTTLIESGVSYSSVARRMGRTRESIVIRCKRQQTRVMKTPGMYNAREVQRLLGLGCSKTVCRWIERGWLHAGNAGTVARPLWRIGVIALWDMLEDENTWMAWHPDRITDPDLRAWATDLRADKPQWLSVGEVGRRLHVGPYTPQSWIEKGEIAGYKYGNWWIRESSLVGFVPPCVRVPRKSPSTPHVMKGRHR